MIASRMGGMDIEAVSRENPEEIIRMEIDPFTGLKGYQLKYLAKRLRVEDEKDLCSMVQKVQHAFFQAGAFWWKSIPWGWWTESWWPWILNLSSTATPAICGQKWKSWNQDARIFMRIKRLRRKPLLSPMYRWTAISA
ncbi:hypothetical protein DXA96_10715 [Lachnospiraceae bacterium OF09-33XD]|nr:hypothetical protein DXA96_10715 [Lachnospiraceae bacterium OF09-33XD]